MTTTRRLPTRDKDGWPYCPYCRRDGHLVRATPSPSHADQPTYDKTCVHHGQQWTYEQRLTWEEFVADTPCRGCGLPWERSLATSGDVEAEAVDARQAERTRFEAAHPDCHAGRQSMAGSLITHCMRCCPPPPMSPAAYRRISEILNSVEMRLSREAMTPAPPPKPTRKQLEAENAALRAEVARLRGDEPADDV